MDYKNQGQVNSEQMFFTAGAGNTSFVDNSFEPENNLDLTNSSTSWGGEHAETLAQTPKHPEFPAEQPPREIVDTKINREAALGEIVSLDLPPTTQNDQISPVQAASAAIYNEKLIRTDGDHIDRRALPEINRAIDKLEQTRNAADFYTSVRGSKDTPGLLGSNLKNSYNREIS